MILEPRAAGQIQQRGYIAMRKRLRKTKASTPDGHIDGRVSLDKVFPPQKSEPAPHG
jgi:hypothetical protein